MKNPIILLIILLTSITVVAQQKEKTYKVLTACGQCQFDMSSPNGCALAIQLAGKTYWVDGSSISDHGNEHAANGLCKTVRKAEVQGTIEGNRIEASSFIIIPEKKKKK